MTRSTAGISSPRDATSVDTSTRAVWLLKAANAAARWAWIGAWVDGWGDGMKGGEAEGWGKAGVSGWGVTSKAMV